MKSFLHVGAGSAPAPEWAKDFNEVRVDIDKAYAPDIVANMTELGDIGQFDVVFCSHALEHLHPYDVNKALKEFYRVLNVSGCVILFVPDLEGVKPTDEVLFESPAGPISGLDLMYGYRVVTQDRPFMRHLTGFVKDTMQKSLEEVGFTKIKVMRLVHYDMMAVGIK